MKIRKTQNIDRSHVAEIYRSVSQETEGIPRRLHEITETYIFSLLNKKEDEIVSLVAEDEEGKLLGVIHATKNGLESYTHILSDLTIIIRPEAQGKGVAKALGYHVLNYIRDHRPDVWRLEVEAISKLDHLDIFYAAGFVKEGEIKNRIRNIDGSFSDSVLLVWFNPNFKA
ncbi:MAG: GNAT family N-acetyltransferase [Flavobacteriales bacterium]|nr:GNAT family N-acetyltransferase [Flavobacteriales bacterium]